MSLLEMRYEFNDVLCVLLLLYIFVVLVLGVYFGVEYIVQQMYTYCKTKLQKNECGIVY